MIPGSEISRPLQPIGWLWLLFLVYAAPLAAQPLAAEPLRDRTPGEELTVFHVTMGPGDQVYEKFEHNALWIRDAVRGTDHVYNYGFFDFDQPGYWGRFIRGDWLYWMAVSEMRQTLYAYQYLNRTVSAQELNLTPAQRAELRDFLEWNARDENRFYYYDYYTDNCATRIRDAIDRALGGQLRAATEDSLTGTTYRWHSERLVADDVPTFTGLLLGLGPGADREINAWEEMFLPGKVQEQLRRISVPDGEGGMIPLVRQEVVLNEAVGRAPLRDVPPSRVAWYLVAGMLVGGVLVGLAKLAPGSRVARVGFAGFSSLWAGFLGTGGLLLFGLWALTNHVIAHRNENLLQFNPLMMALVILLPALAFGVRWAPRPALWLSGVVLALSATGLILKVLPAFGQANGALIAFALPAHAGMFLAVYSLSRRTETRRVPAREPQRPKRARRAPGSTVG
jgi:hypothetical protein